MAEAADSQLELGQSYAYGQADFAEFYDAWVPSLPEQFEVGVDCRFFTKLARQHSASTIADLATGTGRVLRHLLKELGEAQLIGVDHAAAMLQACREHLPAPAPASVKLLEQSLHNLNLGTTVDLVIVAAGSFHHLTTRAEQLACLEGICHHLRHRPGDCGGAIAAVTFLTDTDVIGEDDDTAQELETAGGKKLWRRQTSRKCQEVCEAVPGLAGQDFRGSVLSFEFEQSSDGGQVMKQAWSLRTVSTRAEAEALMKAAGLQVVAAYGSFADALDDKELEIGEGMGPPGAVMLVTHLADGGSGAP